MRKFAIIVFSLFVVFVYGTIFAEESPEEGIDCVNGFSSQKNWVVEDYCKEWHDNMSDKRTDDDTSILDDSKNDDEKSKENCICEPDIDPEGNPENK